MADQHGAQLAGMASATTMCGVAAGLAALLAAAGMAGLPSRRSPEDEAARPSSLEGGGTAAPAALHG